MFLRVVVWDCLVGRRLCLLEACCCIRTWGGLCIRERGRIVSELRVCSGDLETCFRIG